MAFFGSKNDKTILPYIFEDLTEGLEPMRPPPPPDFAKIPSPPKKNQDYRVTRGIQLFDMWALANQRKLL